MDTPSSRARQDNFENLEILENTRISGYSRNSEISIIFENYLYICRVIPFHAPGKLPEGVRAACGYMRIQRL